MKKKQIEKVLELIEKGNIGVCGAIMMVMGLRYFDSPHTYYYVNELSRLYSYCPSNPYGHYSFYLGVPLKSKNNKELRATAFLLMLAYLGEL